MAEAETLRLPGKEVDLATVKDLDDEEYEGLLYYATQWDAPEQDEWLEKIESARGAKKQSKKGDK